MTRSLRLILLGGVLLAIAAGYTRTASRPAGARVHVVNREASPATEPRVAPYRAMRSAAVAKSETGGSAGRPSSVLRDSDAANPRQTRALSAQTVPAPLPISPPEIVSDERLAAAWHEQQPDPEWTSAARISLLEMLAAAKLASDAMRSVACGQSLCRVRLSLADNSAVTALAAVAGTGDAYRFASLAAPDVRVREAAIDSDADRTGAAVAASEFVVYVARPGAKIRDAVAEDRP